MARVVAAAAVAAVLLLLVVVSVVVVVESMPYVSIRSSTQPFTTPMFTTPMPTTPPVCVVGQHQLFPGQMKTIVGQGSCQVCDCQYNGHANCYFADCLVPMCVDAVRAEGQCCATCPNGKNCRIPSTGEVISAGSPVERDGMVCECPPQNYMLPGVQSEADYTAICILRTTIPPTDLPPHAVVGRR